MNSGTMGDAREGTARQHSLPHFAVPSGDGSFYSLRGFCCFWIPFCMKVLWKMLSQIITLCHLAGQDSLSNVESSLQVQGSNSLKRMFYRSKGQKHITQSLCSPSLLHLCCTHARLPCTHTQFPGQSTEESDRDCLDSGTVLLLARCF